MSQNKPYSEAVTTGQYAKKSGLTGKYDNVRRFWEDEVTRLFVRPYLKELVDEKARRLERLKILDAGCGAGDGFELLMGMTAKDRGLYEYAVELIDQDQLGFYLGLDINRDLLQQAQEIYGGNEKIVFREGDFNEGLRPEEGPFDVYFTSYGTLSHNHDDQTVRVLADIARGCGEYALVICDWLGRYSYEWQDLWVENPDGETFMDYRISYIYSPEERREADIPSFPLRLISEMEVRGIIEEAAMESGAEIRVRRLFDRSVFVGRHMDTAEYNRHCPAMREVVNSLLEPNTRTDLESLIIDYSPKKGFAELNVFFEGFAMCWNTLVRRTMEFLSEFDDTSSEGGGLNLQMYTFYPEALKQAVKIMKKVIEATGGLPGDTRANIIEPQLAYALRRLEMEMQPGAGVGHGFVGIVEIRNS
ncbi:MAG: class I SAM-dependent methyltransferase [Candidatus Sulfobium sp.]|jgi:SAM-dependent methyltransferase